MMATYIIMQGTCIQARTKAGRNFTTDIIYIDSYLYLIGGRYNVYNI